MPPRTPPARYVEGLKITQSTMDNPHAVPCRACRGASSLENQRFEAALRRTERHRRSLDAAAHDDDICGGHEVFGVALNRPAGERPSRDVGGTSGNCSTTSRIR